MINLLPCCVYNGPIIWILKYTKILDTVTRSPKVCARERLWLFPKIELFEVTNKSMRYFDDIPNVFLQAKSVVKSLATEDLRRTPLGAGHLFHLSNAE